MTSEKDLIDAVKESLEADGELSRMKGEMRAQVMKLLTDPNGKNKTRVPKPSANILVLNELIREYLNWMGYSYSSTVFTAESDLAKNPYDRSVLVQGLGVKETEDSKDLPLLCSLVKTFTNVANTEPGVEY